MRTPRVIIHPLETLEGNLSQVEAKALVDLGSKLTLGYGEVYIWIGRELSDEELFCIHHKDTVLSNKPKSMLIDLVKGLLGII